MAPKRYRTPLEASYGHLSETSLHGLTSSPPLPCDVHFGLDQPGLGSLKICQGLTQFLRSLADLLFQHCVLRSKHILFFFFLFSF